MITVRDHYSGDLFDPWGHLGPRRRVLLEASWAGLVRKYLLAALPVSRLAEKEPAFKERYRWRAGIEATMSRYKHQTGCAALRVRGKAAVAYEACMGALGLNILRSTRCMPAIAQG